MTKEEYNDRMGGLVISFKAASAGRDYPAALLLSVEIARLGRDHPEYWSKAADDKTSLLIEEVIERAERMLLAMTKQSCEGCGETLTIEEILMYGDKGRGGRCEKCEREWTERMEQWRRGEISEPELDRYFSGKKT